jgi:hypothetical protein
MEISLIYIVILFGAAFLRFLRAYNFVTNQCKKNNEKFEWSIYWKDRWDDWAAHVTFMLLGLLFLPALIDIANKNGVPFLKDIKDTEYLNKFCVFLLGYIGYDIMKWGTSIISKVPGIGKGKVSEETEN